MLGMFDSPFFSIGGFLGCFGWLLGLAFTIFWMIVAVRATKALEDIAKHVQAIRWQMNESGGPQS